MRRGEGMGEGRSEGRGVDGRGEGWRGKESDKRLWRTGVRGGEGKERSSGE